MASPRNFLAVYSPSYVFSIVFLVFSFTLVPIMYLIISKGEEASGSALLTASAMCLPPILSAFFLFNCGGKKKIINGRIALLVISFIFIALLWFVVYSYDVSIASQLTKFEQNKPFFFIFGVVLPVFLAFSFARRDISKFIPLMLLLFFGMAMLTCILYLWNFTGVDLLAARLGGSSSLSRAKILSFGASCALGLIYLHIQDENKKSSFPFYLVALIFSIALFSYAILLSGTRAALLAIGVSAVLLVFRILWKNSFVIGVFITLLFLAGSGLIYSQIEQGEWGRFSDLESSGTDLRYRLNEEAWKSFQGNIEGKSVGYLSVFQSVGYGGIEYPHNTILQLLLETGAASTPAFFVTFFFFIIGFFRLLKSNIGFAAAILFVNVGFQSFSSGTGYDAVVWFAVFYTAVVGALYY